MTYWWEGQPSHPSLTKSSFNLNLLCYEERDHQMDCADYRIHSDCTADSTGYNLLYGLSPYSVTISPCKSITLSRGFFVSIKNLLLISRSAEGTSKYIKFNLNHLLNIHYSLEIMLQIYCIFLKVQ